MKKIVENHKSNIEKFGHQTAGHMGDKGLLKDGKTIYKFFSDREFEVYELFKEGADQKLNLLLPGFYGRTTIPNTKNGFDRNNFNFI